MYTRVAPAPRVYECQHVSLGVCVFAFPHTDNGHRFGVGVGGAVTVEAPRGACSVVLSIVTVVSVVNGRRAE